MPCFQTAQRFLRLDLIARIAEGMFHVQFFFCFYIQFPEYLFKRLYDLMIKYILLEHMPFARRIHLERMRHSHLCIIRKLH